MVQWRRWLALVLLAVPLWAQTHTGGGGGNGGGLPSGCSGANSIITCGGFATNTATAGYYAFGQGTLPATLPANSFLLLAPSSIATTWYWILPSAANGSAGLPHLTASGTDANGNTYNTLSVSPVVEADLSLSNNTTGNATTSAHGFLPILPGGTTTFLRGDGTFATPAGAGSSFGSLTGPALNAQTGTTYTVLSTDNGKIVTFSNAAAIAVTLPQATGSFAAGFYFWAENVNAGLVTITPSTSSINGATTLVLAQYQSVLISSDGTNYEAIGVAGPNTSSAVKLAGVATLQGGSGANGDINIQPSGTSGHINLANASGVVKAAFNTSGQLTTYLARATAGNGLAAVMGATTNNADQTASVATVNVCTSTACTVGDYIVHVYLLQTTTGCATPGSGGVSATVGWTDEGGAKSFVVPLTRQDGTVSTAGLAFATGVTNFAEATFPIRSSGSAAVTFATTYTACSSGTGTYRYHVNVTQLN